ncbi:aldehyde dehydrogenase [Acrocarpospora catenulata]|uniref:aldehyde dehydrogenase n=1 Tax=Acrocarpospora catenulata TaxID=2836182 RepID=UPI001BDB1CBF|nr:aldehyde dehydrogenase [Acrocarpospora catenulata]
MTISHDRLYLGGRWVEASAADRIPVISPATEQVIATVAAPTPDEADAAVAAARASFESGAWRRTPVAERIATMRRLADAYAARVPELGRTLTSEMGAVIGWTQRVHAGGSVLLIQAMCDEAERYPWEEERLGGAARVIREPGGVVVAIPPWNVPQSTLLSKLVPALLAGCSVVVKPSPETPLDALILAELIDGLGLPEGTVSILPAGREIGERLVAHPQVDHVAFTGSTAAGRSIAAVCGRDLKRVTLELGGKSAAIVLDDADLDAVAAGLRATAFNISGQACIAQTRVLAPRSRYGEVVDALAAMAGKLTLGDPFDPATDLGPLVTSAHRDRVRSYVRLGVAEGARAVAGGPDAPTGLDRGWYLRPTVFADVDNRMRIAREEIFGPVLCVIPYADDADAVRLANDSEYGLAGTVWTTDAARADAVARQVRTGMIGVNGFRPHFSLPFGGVKASGIGREFGREGLDAFVEPKAYYHPAPA